MLIIICFVLSVLNASRIVNQVDILVEEGKGKLFESVSGRLDSQGGMNDVVPISLFKEGAYVYLDHYLNIDSSPQKSELIWIFSLSWNIYGAMIYDFNHDGIGEFFVNRSFTERGLQGEIVVQDHQHVSLVTKGNFRSSDVLHAKDQFSAVDINADTYLDIVSSEVKAGKNLYLYSLINPQYIDEQLELYDYFTNYEQTIEGNQLISTWGLTQLNSLDSQMNLLIFGETEFQVFAWESDSSFSLQQTYSYPNAINKVEKFFPFRKHPDIQGARFDFALTDSSSGDLKLYFNRNDSIESFIPVISESLNGYTLEEFYVPEMFDKRIAVYYRKTGSEKGIVVLYTCQYDASQEQIELINDFEYHCLSKPVKVVYQSSEYPSPTYGPSNESQESPAFWSLVFDSKTTHLFYE